MLYDMNGFFFTPALIYYIYFNYYIIIFIYLHFIKFIYCIYLFILFIYIFRSLNVLQFPHFQLRASRSILPVACLLKTV